ncbi:MAG TPA: CBS domain-containing protein [Pyrinomonadaceae bacterium]|jgi:CBS domain-containing protein
MSRNRYEDDEETYYSGRPRAGRREDDRYETWRMDYDRGADDYGRSRVSGYGRGYGREDARGYDNRADYRGRYGRSYDEGDYERDYDRAPGRSLLDEGRDYLRRTFGGGDDRERGRRRGVSRSRLRCREIMTRDIAVATRDTSLQEVARMMREEDTGIIPVVERDDAPAIANDATARVEHTPRIGGRIHSNAKLVGLITDRDIVIRAVAEGKDDKTTHAEEVMTTELHTAHPNDRVIEVIRKMGDKQVRRIPVVSESGHLRGIISMADVALETEADRELADALEEISSGSSFWNRVFG